MRRAILAVVGLWLLAAGVPAAAAPVLKFDDPLAPGGTVSWAGPGSGIVGSDIAFQSILGLDTPQNAGVMLTCSNCLLNFLTDPATATFTPGGSILITAAGVGPTTIELTGGVPALGIADGTTLLSGIFAGSPDEAIGPGREFGLFLGSGPDTKHPALAAFFGLDPAAFQFGTTSIQAITAVDEATGAFAGNVVNADLNNTAPVPGVPTAILLAAGLAAPTVASVRRRLRMNQSGELIGLRAERATLGRVLGVSMRERPKPEPEPDDEDEEEEEEPEAP